MAHRFEHQPPPVEPDHHERQLLLRGDGVSVPDSRNGTLVIYEVPDLPVWAP